MTQGILELIQAIDSGDSIAIDDAFNAEMASRISAKLDDMRIEVAQNMFKPVQEQVEEVELTEEELVEELINEVLGKNEPASAWIKDFVDSDNPKFAGKSKEKRKQMALAAYYAKQKNEELDVTEMLDYLSENEEVLAELSKTTLSSYVDRAAHDAGNKLYRAGSGYATANAFQAAGKEKLGKSFAKDAAKDHSKALSRLKGVQRATDRLAK